jgi:hypothetical protein
VAWIAAGAASTGGLAALVASRLRGKGNKESDEHLSSVLKMADTLDPPTPGPSPAESRMGGGQNVR